MKGRNNRLSEMNDFEEFLNVSSAGLDLREEEVYSVSSTKKLKEMVFANKYFNSTACCLLDNGCIIRIRGWSLYLNQTIGPAIVAIRKFVNNVNDNCIVYNQKNVILYKKTAKIFLFWSSFFQKL